MLQLYIVFLIYIMCDQMTKFKAFKIFVYLGIVIYLFDNILLNV